MTPEWNNVTAQWNTVSTHWSTVKPQWGTVKVVWYPELVSRQQEFTWTTGFFYGKALLLHLKEDPRTRKMVLLIYPSV